MPDETPDPTTFADLPLRAELLHELASLGYEEPTPIQREAIPPLVERRDLLGQAATGTGKTAAFALPILQLLAEGRRAPAPAALVLVPTRELAMQVSEAIHRYGRGLGARVLPVYGGAPIVRQLKTLQRGVDVVVATPGRAVDLVNRGAIDLHQIAMVVLDEADEMLDMGFADDLETLLASAPPERQTVLFSATIPARIGGIASRHLKDPVRIEIRHEPTPAGEAPRVRQSAYIVPRSSKPAALARVLDLESPGAAIVFCRTRAEVDTLTETLSGRGYRVEAIHGGMSQDQRTRTIGRVKAQTTELLVATDVAARGLDIDHLTHVINYDVPSAPEAYVHRIGRVGRAGREGVAVTFAQPREHRMLKQIEKVTRQKITIESVPTVADLRARRLEMTRGAVEEALGGDDLESFRIVVESLAEDHGVLEVALAAVKLAHEAMGGAGEDEEIPDVPVDKGRDRQARGRGDERPGKGAGKGGPPRRLSGPTARVYIGTGRAAGVRPQDLVGAICGETRLSGRDIGAIELTDKFALVEVAEEAVDEVVSALRATTIKGKKATVRRDKGRGGGR